MNVLLLSDNTHDQMLFGRAIAGLSTSHTLTVCESIGELWVKLTSKEISLPNLIFLDMKLWEGSPGCEHDFLQVLKTNDHLKAAPVVLLADSAGHEDVADAYNLNIACFVVLPREPALRSSKIRVCIEFWTIFAELPELRRRWPEAST